MAKFDQLGHKIFRLTEEEIKSTCNHNILLTWNHPWQLSLRQLKNDFAPTDTVVFVNSGKIKAPDETVAELVIYGQNKLDLFQNPLQMYYLHGGKDRNDKNNIKI